MDRLHKIRAEETQSQQGDGILYNERNNQIICAVGDIMVGGEFSDKFDTHRNISFKSIKHFLTAGVLIGNCECPIVPESYPTVADKILRARPETASFLKEIGFDILTLANNHSLDCGTVGLIETKNRLQKEGIKTVGAGENLSEAREPAILQCGDKKIAFFGYYNLIAETLQNRSKYPATNKSVGIAPLELSYVKEDLSNIRDEVDKVILLVHGGIENTEYPSPKRIAIYNEIVKLGIDVIVGHGSHILQGYQIVNGGIISYSLGNFFFPGFFTNPPGQRMWRFYPKINRIGGIFRYNLKSNDFKIIPILQKLGEAKLVPIESVQTRFIKKRLEKLKNTYNNPKYGNFYSKKTRWESSLFNLKRRFVASRYEYGLSTTAKKIMKSVILGRIFKNE